MSSAETIEGGEVLAAKDTLMVTCETVVNDVDIEQLWIITVQGFEELNQASILKQDMTKDEFIQDMKNPDVLKYILYEDEEERRPIGYCPIHTAFNDLVWMNPYALTDDYDEEIDSGEFLYVGSLVIEKSKRGLRKASFLISNFAAQLTEDIRAKGRNVHCGIDFAAYNDPRLPRLLLHCFNSEGLGLRIEEESTQQWAVLTIGERVAGPELAKHAHITPADYYDLIANEYGSLGENIVDLLHESDDSEVVLTEHGLVNLHRSIEDLGMFSDSVLGRGVDAYLQGLHSYYLQGETEAWAAAAEISEYLPQNSTLILDYDNDYEGFIKQLVKHLGENFDNVGIENLDYQKYCTIRG